MSYLYVFTIIELVDDNWRETAIDSLPHLKILFLTVHKLDYFLNPAPALSQWIPDHYRSCIVSVTVLQCVSTPARTHKHYKYSSIDFVSSSVPQRKHAAVLRSFNTEVHVRQY